MYQSAHDFIEMSPVRFNCIEWLPISSKEKVCVIGDLCKAMEEAFLNRNIQIDSQILDCKYDYIILYHSDIVIELMEKYKKHLSSTGRIVLIQRNYYGMSYVAGAEFSLDHFERIGNESTLKQIETMIKDVGFDQYSRYYPYPDSMYTTMVFSDKRLPKVGECNHNNRNLMQDRLVLFDEEKAYQSVIKNNMFPQYANEYLFVIGEELPIEYVKYSNDRAPKYQIKTEILSEEGKRFVRKKALTVEAEEHLKHMVASREFLVTKYEKQQLKFIACKADTDQSLNFPFVKGESLEMRITALLEQGNTAKVLCLFQEFIEHIDTDLVIPVSNLDFIFSNILIEQDTWNVIDYEWIVDEEISTQEIAFRAAYCYYLEHHTFPFEEAMKLLNISENEVEALKQKERKFQENVTCGGFSFVTFREQLGMHAYSMEDVKRAFLLKESEKRIQIYHDFGEGFSEGNSYFIYEQLVAPHQLKAKITIPKGCKRLRVDPCDDACLIKIEQLIFDEDIVLWEDRIQINGAKCQSRILKNQKNYVEYIFGTLDPNIEITLPKYALNGCHSMKISMEIHVLGMEIANNLKKQMMKIF